MQSPSSFVALTAVDCLAVATLARCFDGGGELLLLVPMCAGAHLVAAAARYATGRGHGNWGAALWALGVLLVAYVPIAVMDPGSLRWILPLSATGHLLGAQLSSAWQIFATKVAPVATQRGLVIVAAWAAGAVGLAAEALDADTALPRIVALVPAFDIVVFTGTLGTPNGRALELAGMAALAVWYLALAARQPTGEQVVTARLEGTPGSAVTGFGSALAPAGANGRAQVVEPAAPSGVRGTVGGVMRRLGGSSGPSGSSASSSASLRRRRRLAIAAPGLVGLAAFSAGLIGPILPGATSIPLVAWHGSGNGFGNHKSKHTTGSGGGVGVSTMVQVGEVEVNNPSTVLFDVYSPLAATREQLLTLDHFNGNQWTSTALGQIGRTNPNEVPSFTAGLTSLERHPSPIEQEGKQSVITQVISIKNLAGDYMPTPGDVEGISGEQAVQGTAAGSPLEATTPLNNNTAYAIRAVLPNSPPPIGSNLIPAGSTPKIPSSMDRYLQLPSGMPQRIRSLAHAIVANQVSEAGEALALQDYFTPDNGFLYVLPKKQPSGAIADAGEGYTAINAFLFTNKTGYCQQYASAFAMLARADGIPSRVVIGFLAGAGVGTHGWEVTGNEVHAWPQVWFPSTGWVDYEPTPGSPSPVTESTTPPVTVPPITFPHTGGVPTTLAHNLHKLPGGASGTAGVHPVAGSHGHKGSGPNNAPLDVVLALLAAAIAWLVGAPLWRRVGERRSQRDPVRGVLASWRATQRVLAIAGSHRRRSETFTEFANRVRTAGVLNPTADDALRRMARVANQAAFSIRPPSAEDAAKVHADAKLVQKVARRRLARWQRAVMLVDPRPAGSIA